MSNLFTITESDGKLNEEPNGVFSQTGSMPEKWTVFKGSSDIVAIDGGLPGVNSKDSNGNYWVWIEENSQPLIGSYHTAWLSRGGYFKLTGKTIYGYIISKDRKPYNGSDKDCAVINFITDINFKTGVPTYKGWGCTNLNLTINDTDQYGYDLYGDLFGSVYGNEQNPRRVEIFPILFVASASPADDVRVMALYITDGSFYATSLSFTNQSMPTQQGINNTDYLKKYGSRPITILDTDIIVPSLEDRVDQLEKQVAAFPTDIDEAFALAVDKVSKIFVSR